MDYCAKKCVRITLLCLALTLLCTSCFCLELGQLIEKKISLNGEKRSVSFSATTIAEYDSNGKILHSRTSKWGAKEKWYKYDSNGNEIWNGDSSGFEEWKEYNFLNQNTHGKDSNGCEWENKFDSRGRLVLTRFLSKRGREWRYFYDLDGKLIEEDRVWRQGLFGQTVKFWYKYDAKGNRISSSRETHWESPESWGDSTGEEFWEYDAKGNEIAYFEDTEAKNKGFPTEIYEYKFWLNGNIKTKITYEY